MTKRVRHGIVAVMALSLLVGPTATAFASPPAETASAVEVAKKKAKKVRKKIRTTSSFGMTASGGRAALGTVSAKKAKCVKNRTVRLFLIRPGKSKKLVGVDRRTGRPAGDGPGFWAIPAKLKEGRKYQAVVTKRVVGKLVCKAYKTSKLPFYS